MKSDVLFCWRFPQDLKIVHPPQPRSLSKRVDKGFHFRPFPLNLDLDPSIFQIADTAGQASPGSLSVRKRAIAHTLDPAANHQTGPGSGLREVGHDVGVNPSHRWKRRQER
jgi:hypothetical protein